MQKINTDELNRVLVDDAFLSAIGHYLKDKDKGVEYINLLTKKRFTIKDTDITYRVINHWSSLGLLDDARSGDGNGWRKFSVVDMTWLRILMELRKFGVPLEKIKVGHSSLKKNGNQILERGIVLCMLRKGINLIIFSDGVIEVVPKDAVSTSESIGYFNEPSYLVVNLNNCLKQVFPDKDFSPKLDTFEISDKEIMVLAEMRSGEFDEVSVQMTNGDINRIDTKINHVGEIGKLSDILNKVSHGNFTIKKAGGKISFIESVKKKKV